jgi:hypothetical protein
LQVNFQCDARKLLDEVFATTPPLRKATLQALLLLALAES